MKKEIFWIIGAVVLIFISANLYSGTSFQAVIIPTTGISYTYDWGERAENTQFSIGSDLFKVNPTEFECTMDNFYRAPKPKAECWETDVVFQGKTIDLIYGQKKAINSYLDVIWTTDANVHEPDEDNINYYLNPHSDSTYSFSISNKDFLQATITDSNTIVSLNSVKNIPLTLRQNLANSVPGGLIVRAYYKSLNNQEKITKLPLTFTKGTSTINVRLDTTHLGEIEVKVQPYVIIAGQEYFDDRITSNLYTIMPKIITTDSNVDCSSKQCPSGFVCKTYETSKICVREYNQPIITESSSQLSYILLLTALFAVIIVWGMKK